MNYFLKQGVLVGEISRYDDQPGLVYGTVHEGGGVTYRFWFPSDELTPISREEWIKRLVFG